MTETANSVETLTERVDHLYEFERQPVTEDRLESGRHFAAVFAGEHVAGTEFVIGAVFVSWGVGTRDLLLGLLLGNLLAVLSWTLVCAPIAVQTRLTLYWYLRRIAGPTVTSVYNILNALLFCILSGTMITVSASAVRIPFGIPPQTNWYPTDPRFVLVVLGVGAVVVTVAILGFRRLAQFSTICVPWIFVMFFAGAVAMLPTVVANTAEVEAIRSLADLGRLADLQIWRGDPESEFGFWHVAAFAWICNLAFHVGLSDMAVLRYAPKASYGLYSAFGMYLGHFLAWICAGVMGAAASLILNTPLTSLDAGEVAWQSLGFSGVICVIIAGWATSNPTLYRAGLALQAVSPGWPRWVVTLLAGTFTTAIACFPFVFGYLLEFVALFGILLVPVGAIVFVEHWLFPRMGLLRFRAERLGLSVNFPALATWGIAVAAALTVIYSGLLHMFFLALPLWLLAAILYTGLCFSVSNGEAPSETSPPTTLAPSSDSHREKRPERNHDSLSMVAGGLAALTLVACFLLPLWLFLGDAATHQVRFQSHQQWLAVASIAHLVSAAVWVLRSEG